jgi:hypothetical protein
MKVHMSLPDFGYQTVSFKLKIDPNSGLGESEIMYE